MTTRRSKILLPLLILTALACGLFSPETPLTPTLVPVKKTSTEEIHLPVETDPTPQPTPLSPGGSYQLAKERIIGSYAIRYWHDAQSEIGYDDIVIIEKTGMKSIRIENAFALEPLTGADINGDGSPDVIIETYSGGAHCCFGSYVYSLGEEPILILHKPESNAGGQFQDLDGDDIYEYITYDDMFSYQYCAYVGSPAVKVIMVYDTEKQSYLPASPNFPDEYTANLLHDAEIAETVKPGDYAEWDETTKCGILPLILDYIYLGDLEKAHKELLRVYPYADAEDFWNDLMLQIQDSPLYVAKK